MTTSAPEWMQRGWERAHSIEKQEILEKYQDEAGRYFDSVTKPQKAEYMRSIGELWGDRTPYANRLRDRAKAIWAENTKDARELYELTVSELIATGEVSEELSLKWDALSNQVPA